MERAKSFVAGSSRGRGAKDQGASGSSSPPPTNLLKRSNSLSGQQEPKLFTNVNIEDFKEATAGVDNLAAGGGGNSACKTRLKAKAKVLVQLQSMQGRVLAIDKMLHGLQDVSDR